jgi:hypothetical protein
VWLKPNRTTFLTFYNRLKRFEREERRGLLFFIVNEKDKKRFYSFNTRSLQDLWKFVEKRQWQKYEVRNSERERENEMAKGKRQSQ